MTRAAAAEFALHSDLIEVRAPSPDLGWVDQSLNDAIVVGFSRVVTGSGFGADR